MGKEMIHPDNDQSYFEDISILADYIHNAMMCSDVIEEPEGGSSILIDNLPYEIPDNKSIRKDICKDLCEAIDRINRESDKTLEQVDIGNGDFYEEEPCYITPPTNAHFDSEKLHIY